MELCSLGYLCGITGIVDKRAISYVHICVQGGYVYYVMESTDK